MYNEKLVQYYEYQNYQSVEELERIYQEAMIVAEKKYNLVCKKYEPSICLF